MCRIYGVFGFLIFIQISKVKPSEFEFVSSTGNIFCTNNTVINITKISFDDAYSNCDRRDVRQECSINEYDIHILKQHCDGIPSCIIHPNLTGVKHDCMEKYGYYNLSYECDRKDCKLTTVGTEYNGTINQTGSGKTCQRWGDQSPHKHRNNKLEPYENYCRNPDNEPQGPWCYTIDKDSRWEYCNVPICDSIHHLDSCQTTAETLHISTGCEVGYKLMPDSIKFVFDSHFNDCLEIYEETQNDKRNVSSFSCQEQNQSCTKNMSKHINRRPGCFMLHRLQVEYMCDERKLGFTLRKFSAEVIIGVAGIAIVLILFIIGFVVYRYTFSNSDKYPQHMNEDEIPVNDQYISNQSENRSENAREHEYYNMTEMSSGRSNILENGATADPYSLKSATPDDNNSDTESAILPNENRGSRNISNGFYTEGYYELSFHQRQSDTNNTIYAHTVECVYDTSTHVKQIDRLDGTYDHFSEPTSKD